MNIKHLILAVSTVLLAPPLAMIGMPPGGSCDYGACTVKRESLITIEGALFIPSYKFSGTPSEVELFFLNGKYYIKRQGLILSISTKNISPEFRNLTKKEVQSLIEAKTPIRLYKDTNGEYNIETLLIL